MQVDKGRLLSLIDRFSEGSLLVIGDLLLDHYIWGTVDRISPEAPVVVVQVTEESKRLGGAGNVVHNLRTLGAKASVCGVLGNDDTGREMLELFSTIGADTSAVLVDDERPTTIKTRVIAHAQQVVRVDREATEPLAPEQHKTLAAKAELKLAGTNGIIVSDYAKGAIGAPLFSMFGEAKSSGKLDGLVLVDPKAPNFSFYENASIIKPNRKEAEEASGMRIKSRADAIVAGRKLREEWRCEMLLITLGELGMVLVGENQDKAVEVDTVAREVYDVSGAGDTVSAVLSLSLAVGADPLEAAVLANYAAGVVVGEVGTVAVSADKLRAAVERGVK